MTDTNKEIYDTRYGAATFQLGGDTYSRSMQAIRFDLLEHYGKGLEAHPNDTCLMTGIARIHMMMNNVEKGVFMYKRVRNFSVA